MQQLFSTARYTRLVEQERARVVYGTTLLLTLLFTLFALTTPGSTTGLTLMQQVFVNPQSTFLIAFLYITAVASFVAVRSGHLNLAGAGVVTMWLVSLVLPTIQAGLDSMTAGTVFLMLIWLGGLLNGFPGLVVTSALSLVLLVLGLNIRTQVPTPPINSTSDLIIMVLLIAGTFGLGIFSLRLNRLVQQDTSDRLSEERVKLATVVTQISTRIGRRAALNDVLTSAVDQICAGFPQVYHAQIFLVDEFSHEAKLVASTGDVGKKLLARGHSLGVGTLSVIGRVTLTGTPVFVRSSKTGEITVHRRNEFLPDTQSEAGIPLRIGDQVIGALDLQSTDPMAFDEFDAPILQSLADQIAIAIDNARLFEEAESRVQENQRLVEQALESKREVERLNQELTGRAWGQYLRGRRTEPSLSVDFSENAIQHNTDWTPALAEAARFNHIVQSQDSNSQIIAVPLTVRGQVIGAMEFELDERGSLTPEDLDLVQEVGERFGLAVENTRLFEESQRAAQRETLVNDISARIQGASNVEATLTAAAQGLQETLNAGRVTIRLGVPPGSTASEG